MKDCTRAKLVDFHCHLDLYPNHSAMVQQCERDGVFTLAVTTTPLAWMRNAELASATRHVRAALGLHPQLVADRAHEITLWERLLPETRYVGEVGLDAGPRFYKSIEKQKAVFTRILSACAEARNKILTVHSVRSTKLVLDMIERYMPPPNGQVVLHWFTGTAVEARRAVELGCYFSVNSEMIHNEKRAAIIRTIPLQRILTETDGPFTKTDDHPSRPLDVRIAVEGLARMYGMESTNMSTRIIQNLRELLVERK